MADVIDIFMLWQMLSPFFYYLADFLFQYIATIIFILRKINHLQLLLICEWAVLSYTVPYIVQCIA